MISFADPTLKALITSPLFCLPLTLLAYLAGLKIYHLTGRHTLFQPVVTGIVLVIIALTLIGLPYPAYFEGANIIHFLLSTATVALAIPLYNNLHHIRENARPLVITVLISGVIASASAVLIAWAFGASADILLSLAPKSITTPFAIGVAESTGGYPPLTAGFVIFTGIVVAVTASPLFKWLGIDDPVVQGSAMGMIGHGIATARALEMNPKAGAFSALSMGLMGIYTSVMLPYIVRLFAS